MEMPMSAIAKLNTRKLLGVRSSRTLRKATIVSAFKKKPSRPSGGTERERRERESARTSDARCATLRDENKHVLFTHGPDYKRGLDSEGFFFFFFVERESPRINVTLAVSGGAEASGPVRGQRCAAGAASAASQRLAEFQHNERKHSPSTSRHDPRENTSNSEKPSGKG